MKIISPLELNENLFKAFGKDWALIVVKDSKEDNAMTISWGQAGILWSQPVVSVYVRNTRYTKHMLDEVDDFSICFFEDKYKPQLSHCGRVSRKDDNKITTCGFTRTEIDSVLYLKEAKLTFILKKLYQIDLPINESTNPEVKKHYNEGEFHTQYICHIEKVIIDN